MKRFLLLSFFLLNGESLLAGWLISPGLSWSVFSFEPLAHEATPNYYGYAPQILLGYSGGQIFDVALFSSYTPGRPGSPFIGQESASLALYGVNLGFRLRDSLAFGFRGGGSQYQLSKANPKLTEVYGRWTGAFGSIYGASLWKINREAFWQLAFEWAQVQLSPQKVPLTATPVKERTAAQMSLTLSYTFNGFINQKIENSLFRNVLL